MIMSSSTAPLLPFLLLLFFFFFPWIPVVRSLSTVSQLPGFHGPLPFHLETGYVVVDEVNDVQLFYYFCKSERNPTEDPVIIWLTGGPGCSVLSGLTFEIGPVTFEKVEFNGSIPTLALNPHSWTKVANIIFLDSPVGTGFSFSRKPEGYLTGDLISSKQVCKFLLKWFLDHPEFLSNPFYVAGDSYAGRLVPLIAHEVSKGIEAGNKPLLNLKGYLVGNPVVQFNAGNMSKIPYALGVGIISYELYESAWKNCEGDFYESPRKPECAQDLTVFKNIISKINKAHILEPKCDDVTDMLTYGISDRRSLQEDYKSLFESITPPEIWCRTYIYYLCYEWANFEISRRALYIQQDAWLISQEKGTIGLWKRCNSNLPYTKDFSNSTDYFFDLHKKGYRGLVYSGDHDMLVPFLNTMDWIKSFNLSITDEWRSWLVDGQVGGFTRTYSNNLTFATVKGGGHTAPEYRPKETFAMFDRWISHRPL